MPNDYSASQIVNKWEFSDGILYDMCAKAPKHDDDGELLGKLLIIGRTYAVSLQRTRKPTEKGDAFFDIVLEKFNEKENGKPRRKILDEKIEALRRFESIDSSSIREILSTHKWLTDVFEGITGVNNRSLASKYLHFHLPELFYIYDSRANKALAAKEYTSNRKQMKKFNGRVNCKPGCHCDADYAKFFERAHRYNLEKLQAKYGRLLTPRELDVVLLSRE